MLSEAEAQRIMAERVSDRLLQHCGRVAEYAGELAHRWRTDWNDAVVAGWMHDYCRELTPEAALADAARHGLSVGPIERARPVQLLHAPLAAAELAHLGLSQECLEAISRHTLGGAGMSLLDKCIYVADTAEPGRDFAGVDAIRELAQNSLDLATRECVVQTIGGLLRRGRPIHPATVALYNELSLDNG